MRILLYTGKGGVGKTTIAAATGLELARRGYRTLVMSVDPAHSLSDTYNLQTRLMDPATEVQVADMLWVHEVDIQQEISRHWCAIHSYLATVLNTAGLEATLAEESAVFPGMEEVSCLLNLNRVICEKSFDVVVVDCPPTAESLRFITIPATLEWFINLNSGHLMQARRHLLHLFTSVPPVHDDFFENLDELRRKLSGIDKLLSDSATTTIRLVTNPEKVILRETQRAFTYFCLSGLTVDAVIVNRVLPSEIRDSCFAEWKVTQRRWIERFNEFFAPVPVWQVPLFDDEVLGTEALGAFGRLLYRSRNPAQRFCHHAAFSFRKVSGSYQLRIRLPFVSKEDFVLYKKGDELIIRVGALVRHVSLPQRLAGCEPTTARLESGELIITIEHPKTRKGTEEPTAISLS